MKVYGGVKKVNLIITSLFFVIGYNNNNDTNNDDGSGGDGETASNGKNMLARKFSTKGDTLYLERRVGLFSGVALIVGTMIGKQFLNIIVENDSITCANVYTDVSLSCTLVLMKKAC